jgi:hypothetical protein
VLVARDEKRREERKLGYRSYSRSLQALWSLLYRRRQALKVSQFDGFIYPALPHYATRDSDTDSDTDIDTLPARLRRDFRHDTPPL